MMPDLHYAAIYFGGVAFMTLRAFFVNKKSGGHPWWRDLIVSLAIGGCTLFIPMRSDMMAVLLAITFLVGTIALSTLLIKKFGQGGTTLAMKLMVLFGLMLIAMFIVGSPLVLIGWMEQ